jgi:hypothetical protein
MLTKTPNSERANEPDTLDKLVEEVGPTIAGLARVSLSKYPWFLPGVRRALRRWELDIVFHAKSGNPDRLLHQMLKNIEVLQCQLGELTENADDEGQNNVLLNAGAKLEIELAELETGGVSLDHIADSICCLEIAVARAISRATRPRGAIPDFDRFPGLNSLVVKLQEVAQSSGGNFTAHGRGARGKGSIVRAINEIRDFLLRVGLGEEYRTQCLPARDQHPVATYEKLLRYARPR